MPARRHLPVLSNPPVPSPADAHRPPTDDALDEPPPWHWIPLGTVISVVAFALLAQGAAALSVRALARVYGTATRAADVARIRAARPWDARLAELCAGLSPVLALCAAIALGGYFIGRYGPHTNRRHGALSGALTALLFWAVTGRLGVMLAMVPVGAAVGWIGARAGAAIAARAT